MSDRELRPRGNFVEGDTEGQRVQEPEGGLVDVEIVQCREVCMPLVP